MDSKGYDLINAVLGSEGQIAGAMEEDRSVTFFSIVSGSSISPEDPSPINEALDQAGLMANHGKTDYRYNRPVLKYLGSNSTFHAYEDINKYS